MILGSLAASLAIAGVITVVTVSRLGLPLSLLASCIEIYLIAFYINIEGSVRTLSLTSGRRRTRTT